MGWYPSGKDYYRILEESDRIRKLINKTNFHPVIDYIFEKKLESRWNSEAKNNLYAIEKNLELQQIIRGKGYSLIYDDFLDYNSDYYFDYIIMNPPFDNGAKHLLKAWELSYLATDNCKAHLTHKHNRLTLEKWNAGISGYRNPKIQHAKARPLPQK